MADNFDDRGNKRIAYLTPLQVKDLRSGDIYEAKMLDYSDGGISFASDAFFENGAPLYFGILYPPDYFTSRVFEYYRGAVMWRKDLEPPSFRHGYGVQLVKKGKMVRTVGQIVWTNDEGFGLKFIKTE